MRPSLPFPSLGQEDLNYVPFNPDMKQHIQVHTEGNKRKVCAFCNMKRLKTKSGYRVYTTFKCLACNIPLCNIERGCFEHYHRELIAHMGMVSGENNPTPSLPPPPPPSQPPLLPPILPPSMPLPQI